MPGARDTISLKPLLLLPLFGMVVVVMTCRHCWHVRCPLSVYDGMMVLTPKGPGSGQGTLTWPNQAVYIF